MKKITDLSLHNSKLEINSDFSLILSLFVEIFLYIVKLPFYFIGFLFYFILFDKEKYSFYFSKIFLAPFILLKKVSDWFFEAKFTAYLFLFLFFIYFFEILFLVPFGYLEYFIYSFYDFFEGNFISIFTSSFLHADIFHLFGNCLFLLVFGRIVEREFGWYVILIFLSSSVVADLISGYFFYLAGDMTPSLGASGGVSGLTIFAILLRPFTFTSVFIIPLPVFLVGWFFILLDLISLNDGSNVNHLAHIGGYLAILILMFFIEFKNRKKIIKGFMLNLVIFLISYFVIKVIFGENLFNLLL